MRGQAFVEFPTVDKAAKALVRSAISFVSFANGGASRDIENVTRVVRWGQTMKAVGRTHRWHCSDHPPGKPSCCRCERKDYATTA